MYHSWDLARFAGFAVRGVVIVRVTFRYLGDTESESENPENDKTPVTWTSSTTQRVHFLVMGFSLLAWSGQK